MAAKHLVIVLEGGVIQDICSDEPSWFQDLEITVIDYDEDTHQVQQEDGTWAEAGVGHPGVGKLSIPMNITGPGEDEDDEDEEEEEEEEPS